jgi:pyridoxine 4-dehydrogenase
MSESPAIPSLHASHTGEITLGGDLSVARMGFGAMRITGQGVWGPPANIEEARAVLRRSVELGVTFIDTADSYGPYVSEELIAETLSPYPSNLVIATKGGFERTGPGQWVENGRPEHLRAACEGSLQRLRVERIDLYQLHRIDPKVPADEQFETLRELQQQGKIRHIGLSEVSVEDIERARRVIPIVSVQNRYSVTYRKWEEVVNYCEREKIAFIPWRPIDGGGRDGIPDIVSTIAQQKNATPMQVALAWLLARSPWMLVIPGTSSVAHLEENIASTRLTLDTDELRQLDSLYTAVQS